ncbi:MAG TPA: hypothetical protein GX004_02455 [Firmicutes bacterium]|jgi:hypothetical protein|nr:hypothetical protein [Bacillota bacterium]
MDLALTLFIILIIFLWPRLGHVRYLILLLAGILLLFLTIIVVPVLLLSPLFYLGAAVFIFLLIVRGISGQKKE